MNKALFLFIASLTLIASGCTGLPLVSKPANDETTINGMGKGKVFDPTVAQGGATSGPSVPKPSTSNGASSGAGKPSSSSASSLEPTGAETALKMVGSPGSLFVIPVMPTGEITDMLYRPSEGTVHWELESSRGTGALKLGKVVLSLQRTAKYPPLPTSAPAPDLSATSPVKIPPVSNKIREKGTPVTFDLTPDDVGLSKSIQPGERRNVVLDLKHARTIDFLKANPMMSEFEVSLSLLDEAGSPLKTANGSEFKLVASVNIE